MPWTPPRPYAPAPPAGASRAARERAIALLTDRYADDTLSEAEFEARLAWLSVADDPARIDELVADLARPADRHAGAAGRYAVMPPPEQRIAAVLSSSSRTGQWIVPQRLVVRAVMSELKLDLRYATLPAAAAIDLSAVMANVQVIVPPEVSVHCDASAFMATVRNDASQLTWADAPQLYVSGSAVMAEVRIRVKGR